MAKGKSTNTQKVTFGKSKGKKAQKTKNPKDKLTKKYKGQGR